MDFIIEYFTMTPEFYRKLIVSIIVFIFLFSIKTLANSIVTKKVNDIKTLYYWRRFILYTYGFILVIALLTIWIKGISSLTTFLGLTGAGLAIALHDAIANMAGWLFIIWKKPFEPGDRLEVEGVKGDVIDITLFQFSIIEVGNWVEAEQSTGRIIHIPNSKVLKEHIANYHTGFDYVWHEIPVLITFESNWKKAKEILTGIAQSKAEHLSVGAEEQIRRAAMKYMIYFNKLTPIVYTTVKDSGVLFTIRFIVKPRQRRMAEQEIWEEILNKFDQHDDLDLAYPTTRMVSKQKLV